MELVGDATISQARRANTALAGGVYRRIGKPGRRRRVTRYPVAGKYPVAGSMAEPQQRSDLPRRFDEALAAAKVHLNSKERAPGGMKAVAKLCCRFGITDQPYSMPYCPGAEKPGNVNGVGG